MKRNKRIQDRIKKIPKDVDIFVSTSFEIADRIHSILEENNLEQKDLAKALGKSESEISKWMSGTHNFTLRTLSKIKIALNKAVIEVTGKPKEKEYIYIADQSAKILLGNKYKEIPELDFDINALNTFYNLNKELPLA